MNPGSFDRLLTSRAASNLSDGIAIGMLPLLVASVTRSPLLIAIGSVALYLPWLVVGPAVGMLVDRRSRPGLILMGDGLRALIFVALALAILAAPRSAIWLVPVVAILTGSLEVLSDTAANAHVPTLEPDEWLERANGRLAGVELVMNALIGPALGSLLFTVAPALPVFMQAALMTFGALVVASLPRTPAPARDDAADAEAWTDELLAGVRSIRASPTLRLIVPATGLLSFAFGMSAGVLVLHLVENTTFDEAGYGIVWSVAAIGGTFAAFVMNGLPDRFGRATTLVASAVVIAVSLVFASVLGNGWLVALSFAVLSMGQELWNIVSVAHRQRVTPDELLGRVGAASRMVANGSLPLGGIFAGLLAAALDVGTVIAVAGVVAAFAAALMVPVLGRFRLADNEIVDLGPAGV